jgi:hypothetical protein
MTVEGAAVAGCAELDSMMIVEDCTKDTDAGIEDGAPHAQDPSAQHDSA